MLNYYYNFHEIKKRMKPYLYLFSILAVGFAIYWYAKDFIFGSVLETYIGSIGPSPLAPASIQIRQAPIYPPRTISPSGPNSPNQDAPNNEIVAYGDPGPKDPYYDSQESSDIPENLRHPERSFRPPPLNNNTSIAVDSGVASNNVQVTSDNSGKFSTEFIQGGGEFMPGIFANDTLSDKSYSTF